MFVKGVKMVKGVKSVRGIVINNKKKFLMHTFNNFNHFNPFNLLLLTFYF